MADYLFQDVSSLQCSGHPILNDAVEKLSSRDIIRFDFKIRGDSLTRNLISFLRKYNIIFGDESFVSLFRFHNNFVEVIHQKII